MSRVESVKTAVMKAAARPRGVGRSARTPSSPSRDGVEEIIKAGATAIIQPGGSVRDAEVIAAADAADAGDGGHGDAALPALSDRSGGSPAPRLLPGSLADEPGQGALLP